MAARTDATEFAALAAKRWFYYAREGAVATSLGELRWALRLNARAELAFVLVSSARWAKPYKFLALAYCRRTWCHHLVLDFLAVRPALTFAKEPIYGVGAGMLFSLTRVAEALGIDVIWGEATADSAPFYERVLPTRPVKDLFVIDSGTIRRIQNYYRQKAESFIAKRQHRAHL